METNLGGLNDLAQEIHDTARAHGWWEEGNWREFGTMLALVHSEVSEALEANREHGMEAYATRTIHPPSDVIHVKPEGVPSELADVIIRVLDICAAYGIDIEYAVEQKMAYNETRPHKHGGKAF